MANCNHEATAFLFLFDCTLLTTNILREREIFCVLSLIVLSLGIGHVLVYYHKRLYVKSKLSIKHARTWHLTVAFLNSNECFQRIFNRSSSFPRLSRGNAAVVINENVLREVFGLDGCLLQRFFLLGPTAFRSQTRSSQDQLITNLVPHTQ